MQAKNQVNAGIENTNKENAQIVKHQGYTQCTQGKILMNSKS